MRYSPILPSPCPSITVTLRDFINSRVVTTNLKMLIRFSKDIGHYSAMVWSNTNKGKLKKMTQLFEQVMLRLINLCDEYKVKMFTF